MEGQCEREEPRVYVKQVDGMLKPATLPAWLAERTAAHLTLGAMGLSIEQIRLLWVEVKT